MTPAFLIRRVRRFGRKRVYVVLVAENGEVLSTSEALTSLENARINISAQREAAAIAVVENQS